MISILWCILFFFSSNLRSDFLNWRKVNDSITKHYQELKRPIIRSVPLKIAGELEMRAGLIDRFAASTSRTWVHIIWSANGPDVWSFQGDDMDALSIHPFSTPTCFLLPTAYASCHESKGRLHPGQVAKSSQGPLWVPHMHVFVHTERILSLWGAV